MGGSVAGLERALTEEGVGEVQFDAFARGRYATDASSYQIMPLGVVIPRSIEEATRALGVARLRNVPVLARGGGTSQSGQTVNAALVVDCSKRLTRILSLDADARRCRVEPGVVLDELNRQLKPTGLWFPVDISTASRATIGGMAGNNSCGGRSLCYGTMRDNVISIDAVLADGSPAHFGEVQADLSDLAAGDPRRALFQDILRIGAREADEVAARFPAVQRRVGGYNLDALTPPGSQSDGKVNLAHLLVGSEGTLAFSTAIELKLSPLLGRRAVGVCHFGSFFEAMDAAQHIVALKPIAVELVDRTMIGLAAQIPIFKPTLTAFLRGDPEALLVVEFAESEDENRKRLISLTQLIGDLGFGWDRQRRKWGGVVEVTDPALQASIAEMRAAGLNIMMSMKDARKPVSFVEDCAVPLPRLAEYTARLTEVFEKHGTRGTWYAHASEGCLHVRPVLNLKLDKDVKAMRAIAEEAFALVRAYKGSHSGEHGDGIVRSEFHESMFGSRLVRAFEEVKDRFDPKGLLQSRQDRARAPFRRPDEFSLPSGLSRPRVRARARLVRLSRPGRRLLRRRRDVQQQRRMPEARRRRDVSILSRDPRRARRDAGPRQYVASRDIRSAWPRCAGVRRDGRDAEALRFLQGVPPRMPDRRRHGAHEDRGSRGARARSVGSTRASASSPICRATRGWRLACMLS